MTGRHAALLEKSAISREVWEAVGVRSASRFSDFPEEHRDAWAHHGSGLLFPWRQFDGSLVWQFRLDQAIEVEGDTKKYLLPRGMSPGISVHPWVDKVVLDPTKPLVVVEGTKQHLAAVSAAGQNPQVAVVGIAGCWGWSRDGVAHEALFEIPMKGREVVVFFDADVASNPHVWAAADRLKDTLTNVRGASKVKFAKVPVSGKKGLDDYLGGVSEANRADTFRNLVESAEAKMPKKPRQQTLGFIGDEGVLVERLARDILDKRAVALDAQDEVWVYRDGVFHRDPSFLEREVATRLGDAYRATILSSVRGMVVSLLYAQGTVLPDEERLLNVANGMLDVATGVLYPHDPKYLSTRQIPVGWDPHARAPHYEAWIQSAVEDQVDNLEETVAQMLDVTTPPMKAAMLYGPSRTGKSTFQRILSAVVGEENTSSVPLHAMSSNRFALAELHRKFLNNAADISAQHEPDMSVLKTVTGGDTITAERKNKHPFQFRNQALCVFSCNEIPSVGETSDAYLQRMNPFAFLNSFAGHEDPSVEAAMMTELPGIVVRFVTALQRRKARGHYLPTRPDVARKFMVASHPVRAFLDTRTVADEVGTGPQVIFDAYKRWCEDEGIKPLGRKTFLDAVSMAGVERYRPSGRPALLKIRLRDDSEGESLEPEPDPEASNRVPDATYDAFSSLTSEIEESTEGEAAEVCEKKFPQTITTVTEATSTSAAPIVLLPREVLSPPLTQETLGNRVIIGHGILGRGLPDLAASVDIPLSELVGHVHDIEVQARLDDPPAGGEKRGVVQRRYSLPVLAQKHGLPWNDDPDIQRATLTALAGEHPLTPYGKREARTLLIVGQMSRTGFRADETRLNELLVVEHARRQEKIKLLAELGLPTTRKSGEAAKDPVNTEAGRAFIAQYLADRGVDLPTKDSGQPDLSKEVLELVIEEYPDRDVVEFARMVLEARSNGILSQVQACLKDGRVHPVIEAIQATGRFSVTQPGLTVLPKDERRSVFIPEDGHVLITADLSQIDARAVAVMSQDPDYLANFAPGRDLHTEVAIAVLGDGSKPNRDVAKVITYATSYGAGAALIAKKANISLDEAQQYLDRLAQAYPVLAAWKRYVIARAESGELLDNGHGRLARANPDRVHTTAVAMIGQSCARDLFVEALLRCDDAGLTPFMRVVVHDEIVFSVPADQAEHYRQVISDCMTFAWKPEGAEREVPILCEVSQPATNWADAYPD